MNELAFLFWVVALLALPGPTNTLLFTAGATASHAATERLLAIAAAIGGYLVNVSTLLLLAAFAAAGVPAVQSLIRGLIFLLLIYLAWKLWNEDGRARESGAVTPLRVAATTLFNPKGAIVAFGLWPEAARHDVSQSLVLLAAFAVLVALTSLFWLALGQGAARTAPVLLRPVVCCRMGAITMLIFAALLARGFLPSAHAVEMPLAPLTRAAPPV